MSTFLVLAIFLTAVHSCSATVLRSNDLTNKGHSLETSESNEDIHLNTLGFRSAKEHEKTERTAPFSAEQSRTSNDISIEVNFNEDGNEYSSEEFNSRSERAGDEKLKEKIEKIVKEYESKAEGNTKRAKELRNKLKVLDAMKTLDENIQTTALENFQSYLDKRKKYDDEINIEIRELERKIDESTSPQERRQLMKQLERKEKQLELDTATLDELAEHTSPSTGQGSETGVQPPTTGSETNPTTNRPIVINIFNPPGSGNGQGDDDDDYDYDCDWDIFGLIC